MTTDLDKFEKWCENIGSFIDDMPIRANSVELFSYMYQAFQLERIADSLAVMDNDLIVELKNTNRSLQNICGHLKRIANTAT